MMVLPVTMAEEKKKRMPRDKENPLFSGCIAQLTIHSLQGTFLPLIWFGLGFLPSNLFIFNLLQYLVIDITHIDKTH